MTAPTPDPIPAHPSEAMAWAVSCPAKDECDFRVYHDPTDAECAAEGFNDDRDDDERPHKPIPLHPLPPKGSILTDEGKVIPYQTFNVPLAMDKTGTRLAWSDTWRHPEASAAPLVEELRKGEGQ